MRCCLKYTGGRIETAPATKDEEGFILSKTFGYVQQLIPEAPPLLKYIKFLCKGRSHGGCFSRFSHFSYTSFTRYRYSGKVDLNKILAPHSLVLGASISETLLNRES